MENCRIIELEKERQEVQHEIGVLQRKSAEISILITREWQKDARGTISEFEKNRSSEFPLAEESSEGISQPD